MRFHVLTVSIALLCFSACSTAALSVSPFDDEGDEPAPDAAPWRPSPDARPSGPNTAPRPAADAMAPAPPRLDAGAPLGPRDAGVAPALDAGSPPRAEFDAASLWPTPADAAASCVLHNPPGCSLRFDSQAPCTPTEVSHCAYPEPAPNTFVLRSCTADSAGRATLNVTRVQCPHDCFREIPSSFEGLDTRDCAQRPVIRCDGFPTDQLAVDLSLEAAATACGLTTHHLGLMFNEQGCALAIFGREIRDPAIRCIGKILNGQRFSCAPSCAIANSDR